MVTKKLVEASKLIGAKKDLLSLCKERSEKYKSWFGFYNDLEAFYRKSGKLNIEITMNTVSYIMDAIRNQCKEQEGGLLFYSAPEVAEAVADKYIEKIPKTLEKAISEQLTKDMKNREGRKFYAEKGVITSEVSSVVSFRRPYFNIYPVDEKRVKAKFDGKNITVKIPRTSLAMFDLVYKTSEGKAKLDHFTIELDGSIEVKVPVKG